MLNTLHIRWYDVRVIESDYMPIIRHRYEEKKGMKCRNDDRHVSGKSP